MPPRTPQEELACMEGAMGGHPEPKIQAVRKRTLGACGEDAAATFLREQKGYRLLARNWRNPQDQRDEIDLVLRDGAAMVFVEVKTRAPGALVTGASAVDIRKKRVLKRTIQAFLRWLPASERPLTTRCDIVEVEFSFQHRTVCRHYENISLRTPRPFR